MTNRNPRPLPDFGIDAVPITPGQAFVSSRLLLALESLDDSDALGLRRGAWIIAVECDHYCADARYVLASREVVRLQAIGRHELILTRGDGTTETITKAEADQMVVARVLFNVERP
jgi:hypothetical protein